MAHAYATENPNAGEIHAYFNLKRYGDAMRVFGAAAQTRNRDALRAVADVRAVVTNEY